MIQVLLSTYNGEAYLRPLLDSVLAQDVADLKLLVRDDGSTDGTMAILREYAPVPNIEIVAGENLGAARSFLQLVERASNEADYLAFCDQDDVWLPDKLARAVEWLQRTSADVPALYCSRVALVDRDLKPIQLSNVPRRGLSFRNALVESVVWGCTMVINQAARAILLRGMPRSPLMHDRWIYLVVAAFGVLLFDSQATMLSRRHGRNTSSVRITRLGRWRLQLTRLLKDRRRRSTTQAAEFKRIHGDALSPENSAVLDRLLRSRSGLARRLVYACSCDVYHQSRLGHLMLRVTIALDRL